MWLLEDALTKGKPEIEVAVLSERGLRDENQDWMSWTENSWGECCIVADGMGGYRGGATASRMTVEGLERHLAEAPAEWTFAQALQQAIQKTNEEVYRGAHGGNPDIANMGSTVVIALLARGQLQVAHIGDSRAYLFRRGRLNLLTKDHTSVQRMVDAGLITAEDAREHPEAHVLSRAVGTQPEVEIEIKDPTPLRPGDGILLCSDGLSGYVTDDQIEQTLRQRRSEVQSIPKVLVDLALAAGSDDNITVQFVKCGKGIAGGERKTAGMSLLDVSDKVAAVRKLADKLMSSKAAGMGAGAAVLGTVAVLFAFSPLRMLLQPGIPDPPLYRFAAKTPDGAFPAVPAKPPATNALVAAAKKKQQPAPGGGSVSAPGAAIVQPAAAAQQDRSPVLILMRNPSEQERIERLKEILVQTAADKYDPLVLPASADTWGPPPDRLFVFYQRRSAGLPKPVQGLIRLLDGMAEFKDAKLKWHAGPYAGNREKARKQARTTAGKDNVLVIDFPQER